MGKEAVNDKIKVLDLNRQDALPLAAIRAAIDEVIRDNSFILGPKAKAFEEAFAKWLGMPEVIGVNSGTAALRVVLQALGIGPGDEVITTTFTFIATVESIREVGAKPVLVDIDPKTYCLDINAVKRAVTAKTKAVIPVHLYGHPADMTGLMELAQKHRLHIIEDTAQAHGARWKKKRAGSFGVASAFSFYPGKNLGAYGDAGCCATTDAKLALKMRQLRDHGRTDKYLHEMEGLNERLDGFQAAVLLCKLPYLDGWVAERQKLAKRYDDAFRSGPVATPFVHADAEHAYHLYVTRVPGGRRDALQKALADQNIESGVHYPIPLHLQPCFKHLGYSAGAFPVAEAASREVLSLPLYPGLTAAEQETVIRAVQKFFKS